MQSEFVHSFGAEISDDLYTAFRSYGPKLVVSNGTTVASTTTLGGMADLVSIVNSLEIVRDGPKVDRNFLRGLRAALLERIG